MNDIRTILTADAPAPGGHYAQALTCGDLVYVSGQLPIGPSSPRGADAPLADQARQAVANLLAVLAASGSTPGDLLKVTVYIAGVEHWPAFNAIYAKMMGEARPARSVVPVPALHHGYLVEIDAVARARPT